MTRVMNYDFGSIFEALGRRGLGRCSLSNALGCSGEWIDKRKAGIPPPSGPFLDHLLKLYRQYEGCEPPVLGWWEIPDAPKPAPVQFFPRKRGRPVKTDEQYAAEVAAAADCVSRNGQRAVASCVQRAILNEVRDPYRVLVSRIGEELKRLVNLKRLPPQSVIAKWCESQGFEKIMGGAGNGEFYRVPKDYVPEVVKAPPPRVEIPAKPVEPPQPVVVNVTAPQPVKTVERAAVLAIVGDMCNAAEAAQKAADDMRATFEAFKKLLENA